MAYVINDSCVACGTCIDECPVGAISEGDIYAIDPETCTDCGNLRLREQTCVNCRTNIVFVKLLHSVKQS